MMKNYFIKKVLKNFCTVYHSVEIYLHRNDIKNPTEESSFESFESFSIISHNAWICKDKCFHFYRKHLKME